MAKRPRTRIGTALIGLLPLAGCAGQGVVYMLAHTQRDFPPHEPLIQTVSVNEAYYWLSDEGKLKIALRHHAPPLISPALEVEWLMSMELDGLPAGSEKLYRISSRTVRIVQKYGGDHRRARSLTGIAVIEAPKHGRLRGRFHVTVQQQQFSLLHGWAPRIYRGPLAVARGKFQAINRMEIGQKILARTEDNDFGRESAPRKRTPALMRPLTSSSAVAP